MADKNQKRLPEWIRVKVNRGGNRNELSTELRDRKLNTVCEEAKCPNLAECWHERTATFMLLGVNCTRACRFCAIGYDKPLPPDPEEPANVAETAAKMDLQYVVITSVARDDLDDEGSDQFAKTIRAVREKLPDAGIEVLTPDFNGKEDLIRMTLDAMPTVFNHNLETCERLSPPIRGRAKYKRSLEVLKNAKAWSKGKVLTKSGIMVGLGETDEEVIDCINDLFAANVDILTIGQYLPPSRKHWKLDRYVRPEQFEEWKEYAEKLGFNAVASGPMVRSSYKAGQLITAKLEEQQLNFKI
ncbi:lipoyl synthase [Lentisphaera profundi]|uniref:Lipoyl synthase n=1 Tax=Lentisphaera profundi TaxID=1658616 RepID=A0ABY7VR11_9BACT|nr:lipoyl synthase [Lentisphaera profundi]WDE96127.1 lipoyl synthase [Lentisphaera profundi]